MLNKPKYYEVMSPERIKARNEISSQIEDHLPNLNRMESLGNLYSLAEESPLKLGKDVYLKGTKALDMLAQKLCGLFLDDGVGYHVNDYDMSELMSLLGIESLLPSLQPAFDRLIDVHTFILASCKNLKQNPLIVLFAAEYLDLSPENKTRFFQIIDNDQDETNASEIRRAIIYAALLNSIATTWTFEPQHEGYYFCDMFTQLVTEKVNASVWASYTNAFDRMKNRSIEVDYLIKMKHNYTDNGINIRNSGYFLQINILEAIYQDTLYENDDNAKAGFELLCETYDQPKIECIEQDYLKPWFYNNRPMGLRVYNYAYPRVWNNIYSSWYGCYCSESPESPYYFAALFAPCVSGFYQDLEKGIYIDYHMLTFWVHTQFMKLSKSECRNRYFSKISWLSDLATVMWSKINKKASHIYQHRIETTLNKHEGQYKHMVYETLRNQHKSMFGNITNFTMVNRKITHSPEKISETFSQVLNIHEAYIEKLQEKPNLGAALIKNIPIDPITEGYACCIIT